LFTVIEKVRRALFYLYQDEFRKEAPEEEKK
jgi:hypothetical protein